jgi:hypothetical protein
MICQHKYPCLEPHHFRESREAYSNLSWEYLSLYLMCRRIASGENYQQGRKYLAEEGRKLIEMFLRSEPLDPKARKLEELELLATVEQEVLLGNEQYTERSDCSGLRKDGINRIEKIGELLAKAENPAEFNSHAQNIANFFKACQVLANERVARCSHINLDDVMKITERTEYRRKMDESAVIVTACAD